MTEIRDEYIDVVKIVLAAGTKQKYTADELDAKIERSAARQVIKNFGFTGAPYRVDVMEYALNSKKHTLLFHRVIQNGKLRRRS